MARITSIKPQKHNNRVNIHLDGKFGFGLDLENFFKLGLKVGQELTDEKIAEITQKGDFQKVADRLLIFATLRPRSEKEINNWFRRKKVKDEYKEKLREKLYKLELLDDEKFAVWWIEQRKNFRPKPKSVMYNELRIKGINKEIIDKVLNETDVNEVNIAKELVEKRAYKWRGLEKLERTQKITRFLAGKGFGWETIKKALGTSN